MSTLIDIARWMFHDRVDWVCVAVGVIVAAFMDRQAHRPRSQGYDAWWFFHLNRSDTVSRAKRIKNF